MDQGEKDRLAILEVLKAETAAYLAKDYESWTSHWVQDESILRWSHYPWAGIIIDRGFGKIGAGMREAMAEYPDAVANDIRMEDLEIRLGSDMAWVTYDEFSEETEDPFGVGPLHKILKILHKVDGHWRLACVSVLRQARGRDRPGRKGGVHERPGQVRSCGPFKPDSFKRHSSGAQPQGRPGVACGDSVGRAPRSLYEPEGGDPFA